VVEDAAIYNAEQVSLEAFNNYLEKKKRNPEQAKWSKYQLLEDIGMRDEYEETGRNSGVCGGVSERHQNNRGSKFRVKS
jgi:hypothetical protein